MTTTEIRPAQLGLLDAEPEAFAAHVVQVPDDPSGPAFYPDVRRGHPVYLSGVECDLTRTLEAEGYDVGCLAQPDSALDDKATGYRLWAGDNGMFAGKVDEARWWAWAQQLRRDTMAAFGNHGSAFLSRLMVPGEAMVPYGCLFLTAPDVPGNMEATWERSLPWLERIRSLGFPAAICAQNGAEDFEDLLEEPDRYDAVFLGGSPECVPCGWVRDVTAFDVKVCPKCNAKLTEWKEGEWAQAVARNAHLDGKWVHLGRVNSGRRFNLAAGWDIDSVDGTFLRWRDPANVRRFRSWLGAL